MDGFCHASRRVLNINFPRKKVDVGVLFECRENFDLFDS